MNLKTSIAGFGLEHPILNAAGTCKTFEGFKKLIQTPIPAVMIGSITMLERTGNPGNTFYSNQDFSLNSMGLPNPGILYYEKFMPQMIEIANDAQKYVFANIEGSSPIEYAILTELALEYGAQLVELNLSCPNKWMQTGEQEIIPSYNPELTAKIIKRCETLIGFTSKKKILSIKLSPIPDPVLLKRIADILNESKIVCAVTTSNTLPNTFAYMDNGKPAIQSATELGGMGGPALKPIALGQVKQLRKLLREDIDIVGVGGIKTGKDVLDYLNAGASAVQIATEYFRKGLNLFDKILTELVHTT